ncbi:hypothetical protein MTO96_022866 [Rhipicephalus appendiculatus]
MTLHVTQVSKKFRMKFQAAIAQRKIVQVVNQDYVASGTQQSCAFVRKACVEIATTAVSSSSNTSSRPSHRHDESFHVKHTLQAVHVHPLLYSITSHMYHCHSQKTGLK